MADRTIISVSKFLSLVLRHKPEEIGLTLDDQGWADIVSLIERMNEHGRPVTRELLDRVVAENDKQRFAISGDGRRIRASQGHSLEIDLALAPAEPPQRLYHGTATRFLASIRGQGLLPGARQHVHLSLDEATALKVGQRHGRPCVLIVQSGEMAAAGHAFFRSDNGVWLTPHVPVDFLVFPEA